MNNYHRSIGTFISLLSLFIISILPCNAQSQLGKINLQECYRFARENYPLIRQYALIEKAAQLDLENLARSSWPAINIAGKVTYQSDVTSIPIDLPNVKVPELSKFQYDLHAEVSQSLYDGGRTDAQREIRKITTEIDKQNLEVQLYNLRKQINRIYFGILLSDKQIQQNKLTQEDIKLGIDKIHAAVVNGTALKSQEEVLKADLLKAEQALISLRSRKSALLSKLGQFIGHELSDSIKLETPEPVQVTSDINLPQLKLYEFQSQKVSMQNHLLKVKLRPQFSAFVRGGVGYPALDFLGGDMSPYYIAGIRMQYPLSAFYTRKNEEALITIQRDKIALARETLLFNTRLQLKENRAIADKWQSLMQVDQKIIALRKSIMKTALAQLNRGTITSDNYLKKVHSYHQALLDKEIHHLNYIKSRYVQKTITGN